MSCFEGFDHAFTEPSISLFIIAMKNAMLVADITKLNNEIKAIKCTKNRHPWCVFVTGMTPWPPWLLSTDGCIGVP